ncbi:unnamed protein product [Linum tenue]|uniref:Uncharacterized protein n=1 Tax=Linum tenue TaxID=586396 RepID=A0AAV0I570_9ROSI|nr:unnamed protein product [Linum tenue]
MSYFRSRRWNRGGETSSGSKGASLGRIGLKEQNTRSGVQIPDRVLTKVGRPRNREGPGHIS